MAGELTYYFSTGSRYSYLSMSQMPDIERRYGVRFAWVPVNGKRINALRGVETVQGAALSGQYDWAYRKRDAAAWANYYGIAFREPQSMDFAVELLLHAVIAAGKQDQIRAYAWALAEEVFAHGTWPLDQQVVLNVARQLDLDIDKFSAACADPATAVQLEANCLAAVQRGAFGTPSVFVGDELFWGNDRLPLVRQRLGGLTAQADAKLFSVVGLDHVVLRTSTPHALVKFYCELFQLTVERTVGDFLWQLRIGDSLLDIMRDKSKAASGGPAGANMDHYCLRVDPYDEQAILTHLAAAGVDAQATGNIYGAQGMGPSVYFTDPAGNKVELKQHKA